MGHQPLVAAVPFVSPRLSSYWICLVSGVDYPLARELVAGLASDIVAQRRGYWASAGLPSPQKLETTARRALAEDAGSSRLSAAVIERGVDVVSRKPAPSG
jgi:hypothetical protein